MLGSQALRVFIVTLCDRLPRASPFYRQSARSRHSQPLCSSPQKLAWPCLALRAAPQGGLSTIPLFPAVPPRFLVENENRFLPALSSRPAAQFLRLSPASQLQTPP